jgi:hypothetical protein
MGMDKERGDHVRKQHSREPLQDGGQCLVGKAHGGNDDDRANEDDE